MKGSPDARAPGDCGRRRPERGCRPGRPGSPADTTAPVPRPCRRHRPRGRPAPARLRPRRSKARPSASSGDFRPPLDVPGRDDQQRPAPFGDRREPLEHQGLLAGVGAGGENDRPPLEGGAKRCELGRVGGKGIGAELHVSQPIDADAQDAKAIGRRLVSRQDKVEGAQDRPRRGRRPLPPSEAPLGYPRRDQRQPDPAILGGEDQVRPQFAFHEHPQVRPPMIEEPRHRAGRIDRRVLVDDALGEPLIQKGGRGVRGAGHQHGDVRSFAP